MLYFTSNDGVLGGYNWRTGTFLAPVDLPSSNAVAGSPAVHGDDLWFAEGIADSDPIAVSR